MSIYIQITNRCNMTCAHCCFACTARGSDMSQEDFHRAIALAREYDQHVTIGGGEPTLHPLFKEFLMYAVMELIHVTDSSGLAAVGMVTNGSNTETALTIAKLAEHGIISARVSHDQYHDPVDPRVYAAFKRKPVTYENPRANDNDLRGVNDGQGFIIPVGRAKKWGNHPFIKCVCDSVFITPKGDVYPCGCKKTSLGHVSGEVALRYEHFEGYCERGDKYQTEVLDAIAENDAH